MSLDEGRSRRPRLPFVSADGVARVRSSLTAAGPVDFRPGQALIDRARVVGDDDSPAALLDTVSKATGVEVWLPRTDGDRRPDRSGYVVVHFADEVDVPSFLARLRAAFGARAAAPNTVFTIGAVTADPMRFAGGLGADPMRFAAAYGADPMRFANSSTARPALPPQPSAAAAATKGAGRAIVAVLDTGVAAVGDPLVGDIDFAGATGTVRERPDMNADAYLDIAAGHTTFIRTIISRASPAAELIVEGVLHNDGDGDEAEIAAALARVHDAVADKSQLLVNLSFSGYYDGDEGPPMIGFWIRELVAAGAVVVAAAGNNGACRPKFPAAMPEVIAVSSVGPCGPSWFSNHGRWVDVAAPGEDLVSEFFADFDGAFEAVVAEALPDIDDFRGWAMWSGTSFSAPAVVGALAELIERRDCTAVAAIAELVGRPGLLRLPDYGVVVNRVF